MYLYIILSSCVLLCLQYTEGHFVYGLLFYVYGFTVYVFYFVLFMAYFICFGFWGPGLDFGLD